jgi:hypothetical protein
MEAFQMPGLRLSRDTPVPNQPHGEALRDEQRINPRHLHIRGVLRVVGPLLAVLGLVLTLIGLGSFLSSFANFPAGGFPRHFWCAFLGIPLLGFGAGLTRFAFLGALLRYGAAESLPVAKDGFQYGVAETKNSIQDLVQAVAQGWQAGARVSQTCSRCGRGNDGNARFCDQCGAELRSPTACPSCGKENAQDAAFCGGCGNRLR